MNAVISHRIVGPDGLTDRQRNMKIGHKFAIGALVELENGARAFVVMHTRDCDGTPLYVLGLKLDPSEYDRIGGYSEEDMQEVLV